MSWLNEYKKSLKNVHAEEPLDVYFFRPMAFVIVKTFYSLPITPNHYSLLALISGLMSGHYFLKGQEGFQMGALYFLLFAVLDCCDGMVARLKKNGTEFGRLIDGIVDYLVNIIVYFSVAVGAKKAYPDAAFIQPWVLVIIAGISKAIHSISYDHYLTEYLSYEKGDGGFVVKEIEELKKKLEIAEKTNASVVRKIALKLYLAYSGLQAGKQERVLLFNPASYCARNLRSLRLWSFIGPAVHILFLVLSFIFNTPNILFFYAIVLGNIWLIFMFAYQFKINNQLAGETA